jgi:hypothetical protein
MLEKLLTCSIVIGLSYDSYYKCKKIYNIKRQSSDLPKIEQYMHLSQKEINKLNNKTFEKLLKSNEAYQQQIKKDIKSNNEIKLFPGNLVNLEPNN